jgi:hypothetical protein
MELEEAERKGIPYEDYLRLKDMEDREGHVDPYQAGAHGIGYSSWQKWEEARLR